MTQVPTPPASNGPGAFDHRRYVPVLLTRQGERLALRELDPHVRSGMTPLFVVHPVAKDPATGLLKKTVADHLLTLANQLPNDWGIGSAFVDVRWVDTTAAMPGGAHAIEHFLLLCRSKGLHLAPAISSGHSAAYRAAAVSAADTIDTEVALRLGPHDWHDIGTPVGNGRLLALAAETGRPRENLHLILDLEDQVSTTPALTAAAIKPALRGLPHSYEWASLTVAGTGMPIGTAGVGKDGSAELPRLEWLLWQLLNEPDYRRPSFGDYGVQHPNPLSDFNPLFMDSSAQLRYTISNHWFVARGQGVKKSGNDQIRGLAQQVVDHPQYSGAAFSWGDDWLQQCVDATCNPGNQGLWRKVTTSHHLTYVREQLASLFGP